MLMQNIKYVKFRMIIHTHSKLPSPSSSDIMRRVHTDGILPWRAAGDVPALWASNQRWSLVTECFGGSVTKFYYNGYHNFLTKPHRAGDFWNSMIMKYSNDIKNEFGLFHLPLRRTPGDATNLLKNDPLFGLFEI